MHRRLVALAGTVGLALAAPLAATPAQAGLAGPTGSSVEARGLFSPLSLDVGPTGVAYYSQNFAGQLMRKAPGRRPSVEWASRRGAEVGGVSMAGPGVTFVTTGQKGRTSLQVLRRGRLTTLANLSRYERRQNPDAEQSYGIVDLPEGCEVPQPMRPYTGIVESHPYATAYHRGVRYVADAAANAVFAVTRSGSISTVAVLPPQEVEVTPEVAAANELPDCAIGTTAHLEGVPTDIELGRGGTLLVGSLPGEQLRGGEGRIYAVDLAGGEPEQLVGGLVSPTGIAVTPAGEIFVAELFANQVSRVAPGGSTASRWAGAQMPADVEFADGRVWATRKALTGLGGDQPAGQVVRYRGGVARP